VLLSLGALDHTQLRRRTLARPLFGNPADVAVLVRLDDPEHRHLRHAARLVEGAAGGRVDQPVVGHVLEQRLERDLVLPGQAEGAGDLALARRLVG
jgi:hypothetical protein